MRSSSAIAHFLKSRVSLFDGFTEARLLKLVEGSRVQSFEGNEAILHYGVHAAHLCVVLDGTVTASVMAEGGIRQELGRLEAGSTFGELSLMTGAGIFADLIAESRCEVLMVPVSLFQSVIVAEPQAVRDISRTIADRFKTLMADPYKAAAALQQNEDPYGLRLTSESPHRILVVNCGSSSLKYSFYDTEDESRQARGQVERIGLTGTRHTHRAPDGETTRELPQGGFAEAFSAMAQALGNPSEISVVAHRVVHGGERFAEAAVITDDVLAQIEELSPLAPLHNPVNIAGIREMRRLFPEVPHVAVFDTAFHHTLPSYAFLYGLPYEYYEKQRVRRYGFHGTSHAYVCLRAAEFLRRRPNELEIVSCHLGNGSSLCAVDHGRSVDTTMGFTPTEGLIMGTRCGDVDPGVIAFLERTEGLTGGEIETMLNKKSGLLGLSGISSDMREILKAAEAAEPRALVALKTYCYRIRKYIGAYIAAMGGVDVLIFTGGIGQGSESVRGLAVQGLAGMGIRLDEERNRGARGFDEVCRISADDSDVEMLVVPTDEERMMAREALRAVGHSAIMRELESQPKETFPIRVSAPHAALSPAGQFMCEEQIAVAGPKGRIERVQVLGPVCDRTQVEIAMAEQFKVGIDPPIRESGDVEYTPGCTLVGTAGSVQLKEGVIAAWRHIHMAPEDALRFGVRDKSVVCVGIAGNGKPGFSGVLVRISPDARLAMHIDTDEAGTANIQSSARGYIESIQRQG
jgi:acetate kinase